MRILQLGKAYPPVNLGGVEVTIKLLTEELNQFNEITCDALGGNKDNSYAEEFIDNKYYVYRAKCIGKFFSTLLSFQLIKLLKLKWKDYDVIHVHAPDPMAGLAMFITRPKKKIVLHWHSDILKQKFFLIFYKVIQEWLIKRADVIIATSPSYAEYSPYLKKYVNKVRIVPIGIPEELPMVSELLEKEIRNKYLDKKIIFSLGRLSYYKGFEYLILAAKKLSEEFVVLIGGDGPLSLSFQKLIAENGLEGKVILLGYLNENEKNVYIKICHLFCLTSIYRTEAFGIVQLEAMQRGKPIISTKIDGSGVAWVNQNENTGLTVEIRNPEQISIAIERLSTDNLLYEQMTINCLNRFHLLFSKKKMGNNIRLIYNEIIDK
ncbi:glycosyltransferase [Chitinophagaceae bacterium LWZ2-11]